MSLELPASPSDAPSPPFYQVPGIANLRDIGGYPIAFPSSTTGPSKPRSVKTGLLFRSADPTRVTPEGLQVLQHDLKIRKVFDLRSQPEIDRVGKEWVGVSDLPSPFRNADSTTTANGTSASTASEDTRQIERVWTPVFLERDYSPEKVGLRFQAYTTGSAGFIQAYADILSYAGPAYGTILRYLASSNPEPCLIHCTAGKDRTGVIVALILMLLGVERDVIAGEYALTDKGLESMKVLFRERLLKNEALKGNPEGVERMIASKRESMAGTVDLIQETYGGAEGYLKSVVGLNEDEIQGLRRNFGSEREAVL